MAKEFIISTSRVNSYGTRILTEGGDLEQYRKNPVLLYMHRRDLYGGGDGMVIGRVENIRVEGDSIIGTPVFDMEDEFAAKIARKWESDFLRMCSAGIDPIELSSDPAHLLPGQTRETVTRWKLVEVSIVDIGANDDALKLYSEGKLLTLAAGAESAILPLLKTDPGPVATLAAAEGENDNHKITLSMKNILLTLGLPETATEADALAAITLLQGEAKRSETLELARIESAVDAAISANKLTADRRDKFVSLGRSAGFDHLETALSALNSVVKPTQFVNAVGGGHAAASPALTYAQMTDEQLKELRAGDPERFAELFKAEFGYAPHLN